MIGFFTTIIILAIIGLVIYGFRVRSSVKKSLQIINNLFSESDSWVPAKAYTKPLTVVAAYEVFTLKPLPYWKLVSLVKILLIYSKAFSLDEVITHNEFYPALAVALARPHDDPAKLALKLKTNISFSEIVTLLKVFILQNDITTFTEIYKELHNG